MLESGTLGTKGHTQVVVPGKTGTVLCYAMLCYAMLCYAMLCYAMLCYAMLCSSTVLDRFDLLFVMSHNEVKLRL